MPPTTTGYLHHNTLLLSSMVANGGSGGGLMCYFELSSIFFIGPPQHIAGIVYSAIAPDMVSHQ
jgi:hypothetical protein